MSDTGDGSPKPNGEDGRDTRGRFTKGNRGGPGNPLAQRASEFRQAAMEAISPEHVAAILRKAAKKALEGDLRAARLVLERVLGKPSETLQQVSELALELPSLKTAEGCVRATDVILQAMCQGALPADAARALMDAVALRSKTMETVELEQRLRDLELRLANKSDAKKRGPR